MVKAATLQHMQACRPKVTVTKAVQTNTCTCVRFLTGDYTRVGKGSQIIVPPLKDENNPDVRYDCVVEHATDPKEWVIFNDAQAYPEYIIVFQM